MEDAVMEIARLAAAACNAWTGNPESWETGGLAAGSTGYRERWRSAVAAALEEMAEQMGDWDCERELRAAIQGLRQETATLE